MNRTAATNSSSPSSNGSHEPAIPRKNTRRPKYSKFTQQELPACKPILTPFWVILTFFVIGLIFIPIGIISLRASRSVVEIVHRYEIDCVPEKWRDNLVGFIQSDEDKTCNTTLVIPRQMKAPIFIYYQLDNFYQNHRRYVKSRNDKQLMKREYQNETTNCIPEARIHGQPIVPCGLIAWSLFNDTYKFSVNKNALEVNKKDISWASDRRYKFGKDVYPKNFQTGGLIGGAKLNESIPLSEQEDLIVWMRTAALPTFRKLYGRITVDLESNDKIEVTIQNNYNTYSFDGKKMLVLSTASWLGGKNDFIGIAYLSVGGISMFMLLFFMIVYCVKPRPLGDPSYLSWNRVPGEQ